MDINKILAGKNTPHEINVIIEISKESDPIKYEFDKDSGAIIVDRFIATPMYYPCNYGFIPHSLADDGDPADVLVICDYKLSPGVVIATRPIGVLVMEDEKGMDEKILAVPTSKLTPIYNHIKSYEDLPNDLIARIKHFFEHYKDLESGKWVKVQGYQGTERAKELILTALANDTNHAL